MGNWAPTPGSATLSRAANALICGCLLVHFGDPADGSDDIVYVGTGEVIPDRQGTPGAQLGGVGVLRLNVPLATALSQPFINPWVRQAPELVGAGIFRLAWAPTDRNHIVAATSQGLYRTLNASAGEAAVWTKIKQDPFDFEADDAEYVTDVAWSSSPTRLWVALRDDTRFSDTGVYMSNNGSDGPFHEIELDDVVKNGSARPGRRAERSEHRLRAGQGDRGCGGSTASPPSASRTCRSTCSEKPTISRRTT